MNEDSKNSLMNLLYSGSSTAQSNAIKDFFTMLAVCHTVMVEKEKNTKTKSEIDALKYSASSPDELALVNGAKDVGIEYFKRSASTISIRVGPNREEEDYEALIEFPFDSTRKRMSLIVKNL